VLRGSVPIRKKSYQFPYLVIIYLSFSTTWAYVSLMRYLSFHADVFDLGLASSFLYGLGHNAVWWLHSDPVAIPWNKLIAIPLAYIYYLFPYQPLLLVLQASWLSLGIFPAYGIARRYVTNGWVALAIASSYLLYYPLGGVYWFDFHFMSIFPTFFLLSYSEFLQGKTGASIFFGIMGIITDYLAPLIFIFLTGYIFLKKEGLATSRRYYGAVMITVSLAVLVLVSLIFGTSYDTQYLFMKGSSFSLLYNVTPLEKFHYLIAMLLPFLFLPLAGADFLLVGIPFFALVFVNSYQPYISTMFFQYPALISPILFVSTVKGLGRVISLMRNSRSKKKVRNSFATTLIVLNIILFSFFTPIGNLYTGNIYHSSYGKYISGNPYQYNAVRDTEFTSYDAYLWQIVNSIPVGSSVLIQNNMPQFTDRYSWQLPDFMQPGFGPDYIIVDPYSSYYSSYSAPYHKVNETMVNSANYFLSTGNYHISRELSGITVITKNTIISGSEFVPLKMVISAKRSNFVINQSAPYTGNIPFAVPGIYEISLISLQGGVLNSSLLHISITDKSTGKTIYTASPVNGTIFIHVNEFFSKLTIRVYMNNSLQPLALLIHINEVALPHNYPSYIHTNSSGERGMS